MSDLYAEIHHPCADYMIELGMLRERVKQLESDKARLLEALKESNKHLNSHPAFSAGSSYKSNKQLITEMEG
jgi:tetrahydromethanopterin S-methyltransferase subunit B